MARKQSGSSLLGQAVDLEAALGFVEELASRGTTVLLSTHILEVAQALCRRVAIIDRGHIVDGDVGHFQVTMKIGFKLEG